MLLFLQDKIRGTETIVKQGIRVPLQPGGFTNKSPVVWNRRRKNGKIRLFVELESHINGKVLAEDYTFPFHYLYGDIISTSVKLTPETLIIKLKLTERQMTFAQSIVTV